MPLQLYEKNKILDACFQVFVKKGYANTTTAMLANAAGISRPLIFHHFKSKKRLYLSIVERNFDRFAPDMSQFSPVEHRDFFEAKEAVGRLNIELLKRDPDVNRLMFEAFYGTPEDLKSDIEKLKVRMSQKYGEKHIAHERSMRALFERVPLREGVDRDQAYGLISLVSEHFRRKCLEEMRDNETTLDEKYWDEYFVRTKSFTDMLRYGIEKKGD